jgi:uncharacterized protein
MTESELLQIVFRNPANAALLERLRVLCLPQAHLTAGCLFQAVWNLLSGRSPDWGLHDYDIFYFDDRDLSSQAEEAVTRQVQEATADLRIPIEVKNQARVHLWYPQHFHHDYSPLRSARDGIDRFLVSCTCMGIEAAGGAVYAPDGLTDLVSGSLRMNPLTPFPELFLRKAASYQARWPWLTVLA